MYIDFARLEHLLKRDSEALCLGPPAELANYSPKIYQQGVKVGGLLVMQHIAALIAKDNDVDPNELFESFGLNGDFDAPKHAVEVSRASHAAMLADYEASNPPRSSFFDLPAAAAMQTIGRALTGSLGGAKETSDKAGITAVTATICTILHAFKHEHKTEYMQTLKLLGIEAPLSDVCLSLMVRYEAVIAKDGG